jgi:hypothetical protein
METAAITTTTTTAPADNSNAAAVLQVVDNISVKPSASYNTQSVDSCNQSVQSAITHGTHPHSPVRTAITPLSLSPASSHTNNTNTNNTSSNNTSQQQVVNIDTMGADVMPQYGGQQQGGLLLAGIRQDEWQVLADRQQHQQQRQQQQQQQLQLQQHALNNTYQQNRQRSNPVSDDDITEPSSSANTRENITAITGGATGYTRSDNNTGATSTFGKLIKNATKVSAL